MRGQRDDRLCVGERESDAGGREGVDVRRAGGPPFGAERVGAQRVDGDKENVAVRILAEIERALTAGGGRNARGGESESESAFIQYLEDPAPLHREIVPQSSCIHL